MSRNKVEQLTSHPQQGSISENEIENWTVTYLILFTEEEKIDDSIARRVGEHIKLLISTTVQNPTCTISKVLSVCSHQKEFDRSISDERNKRIVKTIQAEAHSRT
jgi:hypothetical protein